MTTSRPLPLVASEPCCPPGECWFRPDIVDQHRRLLLAMHSAREAISEGAQSVLHPQQGYEMGRSRQSHADPSQVAALDALRLAAVTRAMRAGYASLNALCLGLCPYALSGPPNLVDDDDEDVEWIDTAEAARRLGVGLRHLRHLALGHGLRRRRLTSLTGRPGVYAAADIDRLAAERARHAGD